MTKYFLIILIFFHLMGSSLYATKTFLEKNHIHNHNDRCDIHQHNHSHNGSNHQHKHSHSQQNMNLFDFFTDTKNTSFLDFSYSTQVYLETDGWIPNPALESLFRPPKV